MTEVVPMCKSEPLELTDRLSLESIFRVAGSIRSLLKFVLTLTPVAAPRCVLRKILIGSSIGKIQIGQRWSYRHDTIGIPWFCPVATNIQRPISVRCGS